MRKADYSWVILATGFTVMFFGGGARFVFGLMLKPMSDDLGWSRSSLSLAATTFMVVSALAMPLMGRLTDRYSIRWILGAGAFASALGILLMWRVSALWQVFMVYGVLYGIGNAASSNNTVGVMISRWFERSRGAATSAALSGSAIGQLVIIMLLASFLTALGWRTSYAVLGAANMAIVVPVVLAAARSRPPARSLGPESRTGQSGPKKSRGVATAADQTLTLDAILRSRPFWLLFVMYAICGFQDFFVSTHVVAFALDQGLGTLLAGNMLAIMGAVGVIGVMSSGVLADAFGAKQPTGLCFLVRIAIFPLVLYFQSTLGIFAFGLLYGFTFMITAPLIVVFVSNIFGPARLGTVSGIFSMVHQISGGLGALVGAVMFDRWGSYDQVFVLMFGLSLAAMATTYLIREQPLRPAPAPA